MTEKEVYLFIEKMAALPSAMGVLTFSAGRYTEVDKAKNIDSFVQAVVNAGKCLAAGGAPSDYSSLFNMDLPYSERGVQSGAGNGFVFSDGKCQKIKLIES